MHFSLVGSQISKFPNLINSFTGRCSNNGLPGGKGPVVNNTRRSTKCNCNASFTFHPIEKTLVFKHHLPGQIHHPDCNPLSPVDLRNRAHIFRGLQTPEEASARLIFVTSMFTDNYSTRNAQVTNLLNGQIRREVMNANDGILPAGTPFSAPKAYTDTLIRAGKAAANGNVSHEDSLAALINLFEKDSTKFAIQNDIDNQGVEVVSAIVYHDEVLAPTMEYPCSVYTADVTFGITDSACGFAKWFFFSRLLASKLITS